MQTARSFFVPTEQLRPFALHESDFCAKLPGKAAPAPKSDETISAGMTTGAASEVLNNVTFGTAAASSVAAGTTWRKL